RKGSKVYQQWIKLNGPSGEIVRARAVIDGGAMRNTMCTQKWEQWEHRLGGREDSPIMMQVADNHHIPLAGRWTGRTTVSGVNMDTKFEMFDSNGAFEIILGKLWLQTVKVVHYFKDDTIRISAVNKATMIRN
ncbi:hypothetical protein M422DRAFT_81598, partial [Sphaerobolus stellatus SS14]